jgi:lipoate-protein ligase A
LRARFLDLTLGDPYSNLAAEEAIFRLARIPSFRVWDNQRSVIIGRAQKAEIETDVGYCRENGIPIVRRFTAGGAVYNGPGNLNWSFFAPALQTIGGESGRIRYTSDAGGVFASFASIVVEALAACSVPTRFAPPNRIENPEGRKVSGMAAYISKDGVVCHGTLLLNADLDEATRVSTPSRLVVERKYPRSNFTKIANTGAERDVFVRSILLVAELEWRREGMTEEEAELTRELRKKYARSDWNLGDPFVWTETLAAP